MRLHRRPRAPTSSGSSRPTATAATSARPIGAREVGLPYMRQIAQAADQLGYFGVLLPTGRSCEDSWVVGERAGPADRAAALPGRRAARACTQPSMSARMAATLDRHLRAGGC